MSASYPKDSVLHTKAREIIDAVPALKPQAAIKAIIAAQRDDYRRLTDPTTPYAALSSEDKDERRRWSEEGNADIVLGHAKFVVDANASQNQIVAPTLTQAVREEVANQSRWLRQQFTVPAIVYAVDQKEPYRYEPETGRLYVNQAQLKGTIDITVLRSTLEDRHDRSDARLDTELRDRAEPYVIESMITKPRQREARVEAEYSSYRDATDPNNTAAIMEQRNRQPLNENQTIVTADSHPAIYAAVVTGVTKLNHETGNNYPLPRVVVEKGYSVDGSSTAAYNPVTGTIILDAQWVREHPEAVNGIIGHELGHRYARDESTLKTILHKNISDELNIPPDPEVMKHHRDNELRADAAGACIVGPLEMHRNQIGLLSWAKEKALEGEPHKPATNTSLSTLPDPRSTHPSREDRMEALLEQAGVSRKNYGPQEYSAGEHTPPPTAKSCATFVAVASR